MNMGFFLTFQRRHVETGEPLTDNTICWTFTNCAVWENAVAEIKSQDHLCFLHSGRCLDKSYETAKAGTL
jgi:hypothetical protein